MPVPIPYVQAAIGLVCVVVAVPMMFGFVGRNRYFGIRLAEALASDGNWRKINSFGGRRLALFGMFLLVVSYLLRDIAPPPTSAWSPVVLVVPLTPLVLVIRSIQRFAAGLPPA